MTLKKADVWMPLFIGDYLADTAHLSTLEHGAYLLLLMQAWMNDGLIPDDDRRLARICRLTDEQWIESGEYLRQFFIKTRTGLRHKRIDLELAKAEERINQASAAGKASAAKRAAQRELDRQLNANSTAVATGVEKSATDVQLMLQQEFNSKVNGKATQPSTKTQLKSNSSPSPSPSGKPFPSQDENVVIGIQGRVDPITGELIPGRATA